MSLLSMLNRMAPALAAAALIGVYLTRPFEVREAPGTDVYFEAVRDKVAAIPYKIGNWLGKDVEVSVAAVRLLKPNVLVQRQYTNQDTGRSVQLLVVHCGDTRDMRGHYPPICYPAHGWEPSSTKDMSVGVGGARLPAKFYGFSRLINGVERRMSVVNLFVVPRPDQSFFADMNGLERASQDIRGAGLGAAQIQIVSSNDELDLASATEDVDRFFESLKPVLQVVAEGAPKHES